MAFRLFVVAAPCLAFPVTANAQIDRAEIPHSILRTNGIPYSEDAVVAEYFYRHSDPRDLEWLTVTTIVEDQKYLTQPFMAATDFLKEPDGSTFAPTPGAIDPPRPATAP